MAKTPADKKKSDAQGPLILAEELVCQGGQFRIGIMTLNSAKTMNAVDLAMVNQIDDVLARWQNDDGVVAAVMRGAGDKAFSAGGDIRQLYNSMQAKGSEHLKYADAFFTAEYSKNYRVHQFGKPLIAWGHGFVMGGGLGLFIGANHKVGTETLRLAWPEIRIGLFPDVAGSYYLSRLPYPLGHWMALSGSQMNAVDCKQTGLINYCLSNEAFNSLIDELVKQPWQNNKAMNNQFVQKLLQGFEQQDNTEFPASKLDSNMEDIKKIFVNDEANHTISLTDNKRVLTCIAQQLSNSESSDPWFIQGKNNFLGGCPATAHIIMQQLQLGRHMTLKEVVMWELVVALQSVRQTDFAEGIRAMVVDKDGQPEWQHESVENVPIAYVEGLQQAIWAEGNHPFLAL
jgi:enoyl-CoA hydratase/carnithine racemase